jgi:adenylate cyclase
MTTTGGDLGRALLARLNEGEMGSEALVAGLRSLPAGEAEAFLRGFGHAYQEQGALLEIAEALGSQLGLVPLLERILERTSSLLRADRASVFLLDRQRGELWSKVAQGMETAEIRFPMDRGIAGHVATSGQVLNIPDAYQNPLFNPDIDQKTGYHTKSVLCAPVRDDRHEIIGVVSVINRRDGAFTEQDADTLTRLSSIIGLALRNSILYEEVLARQSEVSTLLEVGQALAQTLDLAGLIQIIMTKAREIMDAERSTLFLIDRKTRELWSKVAEGTQEIRFPLGRGIAGYVASTGQTLNIADAYEHPMFNREIDQKTGYRTRTLLCVPLRNPAGEVIGVTQVVNKRVGPFTAVDERLLGSFSAQAAVAIDNAQLYERVREMKSYLESIVQSLSNGLLTVDAEGAITTANASACRILQTTDSVLAGRRAADVLRALNPSLVEDVGRVQDSGKASLLYDLDCRTLGGRDVAMNINTVPLLDLNAQKLGVLMVLEDITAEKRVKSSLSRYMSKDVVEKLLADEGSPALGGVRQEVSILFSDIRSYTSLTEDADAHEIVGMLNEYFTQMVDVIFEHEGILDKFIGDAIMAVFGAPFARPETDPVNAVAAAVEMQAALERYNAVRVARGQKPIDTGIGISSGEVVCGNIGSEKRMDYTVIGDGVNLASRLEGATKQYGAHIMVSEFTQARTGARFVTRELDRIRVKGKNRPVQIYEVMGRSDRPVPEAVARRLDAHEGGMKAYRKRAWREAMGSFGAAVEAFPKDKVFALYADRCRYFLDHPPGDDWDGVWELKDK